MRLKMNMIKQMALSGIRTWHQYVTLSGSIDSHWGNDASVMQSHPVTQLCISVGLLLWSVRRRCRLILNIPIPRDTDCDDDLRGQESERDKIWPEESDTQLPIPEDMRKYITEQHHQCRDGTQRRSGNSLAESASISPDSARLTSPRSTRF